MQRILRSRRPQLRFTRRKLSCSGSCSRTVGAATALASVRHCVALLDQHRSTNHVHIVSKRFTSSEHDGCKSSSASDRARSVTHSANAVLNALDTVDASDRSKGASELPHAARLITSSPAPSPKNRSEGENSRTPPTADEERTLKDPAPEFSQGLKDFCWREDEAVKGIFKPSVLYAVSLRNRIRLFGMPKGYPDTTAVGFRRFFYLSQANSFIADFSACIGYQSLLSGFFLGSSPQMWMLKDLFPALFAAYMANRIVSYEGRPKQWFCVSVLLRNVTIIADMVIPTAVPNHMVLCAVGNAVLKQSSALMFFITRAAALQHYSIDNNLAELTKKFNSFSMVTFTLATALAIVYCTFLTSFTTQLTTILVCCVANLVLSYMAMKPVAFRILHFASMQVLMPAYVHNPCGVMTPQEVSDAMGIRMSPAAAVKGGRATADTALNLLYVSPPVDKLLIRSDRLHEDVLYRSANGAFLLAMWRPSAMPLTLRESWRRYELPSLPRFLREGRWRRCNPVLTEVEKRFHGHRLCLLVQHRCSPKDLITAYLIMHTTVLQHAATEAELRTFVRRCHAEQDEWDAKGETLHNQLREAGWDVNRPALDHHDFRVSELLVQRPAVDSKATTASSVSSSDIDG
ncbi:hypothetical protein ABB37_01248 [Leptomonas pyrrhocoris]|uniref:Protein root UVB sensitive/RUS domain-containing protein n=1 Tax=Leptomonas pyrrhocoris TaxID=157538 RepID=A0A0M9G8E0_LEPPY|nr:hypothetical protein ABB37_01248 [Leptomonas pyrrhocoris]KPA84757.1 hypothetical protein ABB37_01248 [Leptomonas pyrrhocoris]|eukprot:XP_015663196.1 hypothetical protein ABB37_01248 [Leptomonas pyrrhocoris]